MKGGSTEEDREDRRQVNTLKQCPVRSRTKAHVQHRAGPGIAGVGSPGARGLSEGSGLREAGPEI